jgi:hypothetical protein
MAASYFSSGQIEVIKSEVVTAPQVTEPMSEYDTAISIVSFHT